MRDYIVSLRGEAIHSPFSSLRGMSEANDEAIYNQAYFKDSIANTSARFKVIDCHESRCGSRNDKVEYALVSRHCEAVRKHNEAIHNHANQTILNGNTQGARQ